MNSGEKSWEQAIVSYFNTFIKEMLPQRCTKMELLLYTEFMSGEGIYVIISWSNQVKT